MKLNQIGRKSMKKSKVEDFFDKSYERVYEKLLKVELHQQLSYLEVNFLRNNRNIKILDLCCGTGRHLIPLNHRGYKVDGVDINQDYINSIGQNLHNSELSDLYISDVRNSFTDNKYDLIYSFESSVGYVSDSETEKIFKNISSNLLKDHGLFVLQLINKDYLIKHLVRRMWFGDSQDGYVLEERLFNPQKDTVTLDQVRIIDGIEKNYSVNIRLYSFLEINQMLNQAGLNVIQVHGTYENKEYGMDSPYMIITSRNF